MGRETLKAADSKKAAEDKEYMERDYLDSLIDKLEDLGLADESYVNQLSDRLEPVLGEL